MPKTSRHGKGYSESETLLESTSNMMWEMEKISGFSNTLGVVNRFKTKGGGERLHHELGVPWDTKVPYFIREGVWNLPLHAAFLWRKSTNEYCIREFMEAWISLSEWTEWERHLASKKYGNESRRRGER